MTPAPASALSLLERLPFPESTRIEPAQLRSGVFRISGDRLLLNRFGYGKCTGDALLDARYVSDDGWDGLPEASIRGAILGALEFDSSAKFSFSRLPVRVDSDGSVASSGGPIRLIRLFADPVGRFEITTLLDKHNFVRTFAEYSNWSAVFRIRWNERLFGSDIDIAGLLSFAGKHCGLGEGRIGHNRRRVPVSGFFTVSSVEEAVAA